MGRTLWIDMESTAYVDGTIELYEALLARSPQQRALPAGLPPTDLGRRAALPPAGPTIRLVKGAYRESKEVAFQESG